jgi:rubrerythrin
LFILYHATTNKNKFISMDGTGICTACGVSTGDDTKETCPDCEEAAPTDDTQEGPTLEPEE